MNTPYSFDPDIANIGTANTAPGSTPLRPSDLPGRKEVRHGLGVLGDDEDALSSQLGMMSKAQEEVDKGIVHAMRETASITIGGLSVLQVSMETLAMLQEIGSPFVTFTPILTSTERERLQKLANRKLGITDETPAKGGKAPKNLPLSSQEEQDLVMLLEKAKEENRQFQNAPLEVLKFFAIHDPSLSDAEREEMVFDDRKKLRSHALRCGRLLDMTNLDKLGEEIGRAIADAKSTKVRPVSKERGSSLGNT
jgi:hypothetical protein